LNRSGKLIPNNIVQELEEGKFTSEMIDELAGTYPVYRYRTCITIHGNWPQIEREKIGGYKNIHQNQNGSLEVYYSAIDQNKLHHICKSIRGISKFGYTQSSTGREFYIQAPVSKETLPEVRAKFEPIAKQFAALEIYGHINLYLAQTPWGQTFLVLSLHPLAIPDSQVGLLILTLCQMQPLEYGQAVIARDEQIRAEEEARKVDYQQYIQRQAEAKEEKQRQVDKIFKPQLVGLQECRDLNAGVLVGITGDSAINFVFYRKDGAGAFGRVKYSKALSMELRGEKQWKEMKQEFEKDILRNVNTYYLLESRETKRQTIFTEHQAHERKVLATINY